jgi:hypothetical protein
MIVGDNLKEMQQIKDYLNQNFSIKDLGTTRYFLGLEIARSKDGIVLYQRKYCLDLLKDTGMLGSSPKDTPIEFGQKLVHSTENRLEDITAYRRLVGKLIYLTSTRPDISFVVGRLSQFLDAPTQAYLNAAMRVLRYLKNSPGDGLFFSANTSMDIIGYSNSDWGSCKKSRKSISAYSFFIGDNLISWKSKK